MRSDGRLARYAWITLAVNLGVILLGAVVRATGSGAGCGANWPTCDGELVPIGGATETLIEFSHRATSGVAIIMVGVLVVWAVRSRERGDAVRVAAIASGVLIFNEALIGAMLVLFEWVAEDSSVARAISTSIHLVNTFLLVGALAVTAWWAQGRPMPTRPWPEPARGRIVRATIALLVVGAMGAITALGDTLFPPESIVSGIEDDLTGVLLVRLRWIHPVLAIATAVYLLRMAGSLAVTPTASRLATSLHVIVGVQVLAGFVNVALLAPLWMQLVHLGLADTLWILFVLLAAESLAAGDRSRAPA